MNITNRVAKTVDDMFFPFKYKLDTSTVTSAVCIALTNFGGDDTRAVYEIYVNDTPRFFAVSTLEYPEDENFELEAVKKWVESNKVKLLEKCETAYLDFYLFELISPFGISFGKLKL